MNSTVESVKFLRDKVPGFSAIESSALGGFQWTRSKLNGLCEGYNLEPWQIIILSMIVLYILQCLWEFMFEGEGGTAKAKKTAFKLLRRIPYIKRQVDAEVKKTAASMKHSFGKDLKPGMTFIRRLPAIGYSAADVCTMAEEYKSMSKSAIFNGRASGTLYNGGAQLTDLNAEIYKMFAWTNPLHTDVFPDIRKMEAEVVQMCVDMFNGGPDACGTMTSGGTESIMLACKAYRDRAISKGIKRPEMVLPRSAHAAFEKSCQSFNIIPRFVPSNPNTMKADVRKMKKLINRNTCMLVCSCPDFPIGMIDPIEEISEIGLRYDIPVHVDACLGGFLVPFMEKAGFPLPLFDFRLPGVSSISCDTHKYGFAPKGSSVVLYANEELRRYQFFVITDWPGGIYATPTLGGSRAGAIIAACWATMMYYGEEGYVKSTREVINVTRYIISKLTEIEGIFIYGDPQVSVVTIGSLDFDIYRLFAAMTDKGWSLNALQYPSCFHLCCTLVHTKPGVADDFINDIKECTAKILADPKDKASGMAAMYGMSQAIPDRSLVGDLVMEYLNAVYDTNYAPLTNGHAL